MWPLKKTIKLTAITTKPYLVETFPIVAAKDSMPSWYKSIPLTYEKNVCPIKNSLLNLGGTVKNCTGVNTLLRKGFILRAWEDMSIVVYPDGTFSSVGTTTNPPAFSHDKRQLPASMQNYTVVKLHSPWFLYGDTSEYVVIPAAYHDSLSRTYYIPSGVVNFNYQHATHVFLAVEPKEEPYEIFIKAGQPLTQLIPLTDTSVELVSSYDPMYRTETPSNFYMAHPYNRYLNWMKRKRNAS